MIENMLVDISVYLARAEERTIHEFINIVGYRTYEEFKEAGYIIISQKVKDGRDGIMLWKMSLLHDKTEIAHQNIEIKLDTEMWQ